MRLLHSAYYSIKPPSFEFLAINPRIHNCETKNDRGRVFYYVYDMWMSDILLPVYVVVVV